MDLLSTTIGTLDVSIAMFAFHTALVYLAWRGTKSFLAEIEEGRKARAEKDAIKTT